MKPGSEKEWISTGVGPSIYVSKALTDFISRGSNGHLPKRIFQSKILDDEPCPLPDRNPSAYLSELRECLIKVDVHVRFEFSENN